MEPLLTLVKLYIRKLVFGNTRQRSELCLQLDNKENRTKIFYSFRKQLVGNSPVFLIFVRLRFLLSQDDRTDVLKSVASNPPSVLCRLVRFSQCLF